jgi:hypothetical protein
LQFPHPLASPELQDLLKHVGDHWRPLTADERRRPETSPLPLRRPAIRVSAASAPPARRHPGAPLVLSGESCRRLTTVGPTAVPPPRSPEHGDRAAGMHARAATAAGLGREATAQPGLPAYPRDRPHCPVEQAAPCGLDPDVGFRPSTVLGIVNMFSICFK